MTTAVYVQSQSTILPVIRAVIIVTTDEMNSNPLVFFSSPTIINQLFTALEIDSSLWYLAQTALYGVNTFETRQSYTFYVVIVEQGVTIDLSKINSSIIMTGGASGSILVPAPGPTGPAGPPGPTGPGGGGGSIPVPTGAGEALISNSGTPGDFSWQFLGGDATGTYQNLIVSGFQTIPVANTAPVQSAVPVYDSGVTRYDIRQLTEDDILPGFSITGFSGGSTVEVGATVIDPAFTASYTSTPVSAQITNTDVIDSPLVLSSPFTSGTVVGSFSHSVITSVVFTLTAMSATTKTANQSINFLARSFGGVGTTGATSATASGNNAILVGASGTLNDEGLHGSDVGQVYGSFTPSGQKIYLLLPHSATHTFHDQNGFLFPMDVPTNFSFTNQNGAVLSYDLYESTNVLSTPFTLTVVS